MSIDLVAYLGDSYDETTPAQREAIEAAAEAVERRYPEPDLADSREAALTGAVQVILGDTTLEELAEQWHQVVAAERAAMEALTGAFIASHTPGGRDQASLARRANVAVGTVRAALGKARVDRGGVK